MILDNVKERLSASQNEINFIKEEMYKISSAYIKECLWLDRMWKPTWKIKTATTWGRVLSWPSKSFGSGQAN